LDLEAHGQNLKHTLILTLALWLTTPLHGLHMSAIAAIPIVIFTLTGLVGPAELKCMSWDTLMLVAGLTLAEALDRTGLDACYVHRLHLATVSPLLVLLVFGYFTVVMSNVMSNTATASLLIAIGIQLVPAHALEIALTTGLCASFGMLPVSTPTNAIVFSTGHLQVSDFRKTGFAVGLIGPLLTWLYLRAI
jgi:sodium-dependent dicarboxylate transporter 2/3/5